MGNGTVIDGFGATVADIGCLIEAVTAFPYKVRAGLVTGGAGSASHIAEDDLTAYIGLTAVIAVYAEVVRVIEGAFMIPVTEPVRSDLLGDGGRVFTEIFSDLFKGEGLIQRPFNISAVIEGKMFLVTGYVFTHGVPPSTAVRKAGRSYHGDMKE